jgi:hypothetical protein
MVNAFDEISVTRRIAPVSNSDFTVLESSSNPKVDEFRLEFGRDRIWRHGLISGFELIGERAGKLEVACKIRFGVSISGQYGLIE